MAHRTKRRGAVGAVALSVLFGGDAAAMDAVKLYAAGSLKAALTELAKDYQAAKGIPVEATFGPSGLLKERLEKGEPGDVFASANMEHPKALADAGRSGLVRLFARNQLCALAQPDVEVTPATLLERILDPKVRVVPGVMGDLAKGVKAFKAGMKDEDESDKIAGPNAG